VSPLTQGLRYRAACDTDVKHCSINQLIPAGNAFNDYYSEGRGSHNEWATRGENHNFWIQIQVLDVV